MQALPSVLATIVCTNDTLRSLGKAKRLAESAHGYVRHCRDDGRLRLVEKTPMSVPVPLLSIEPTLLLLVSICQHLQRHVWLLQVDEPFRQPPGAIVLSQSRNVIEPHPPQHATVLFLPLRAAQQNEQPLVLASYQLLDVPLLLCWLVHSSVVVRLHASLHQPSIVPAQLPVANVHSQLPLPVVNAPYQPLPSVLVLGPVPTVVVSHLPVVLLPVSLSALLVVLFRLLVMPFQPAVAKLLLL